MGCSPWGCKESDTTTYPHTVEDFPAGSVVKNLPADARDARSIPVLGRSPGEGDGHLLYYSCLENLMDRGTQEATAHGVRKESDVTLVTEQQYTVAVCVLSRV